MRPPEYQRCQLLEIKCGWNANSTLLSGPISWSLKRGAFQLPKLRLVNFCYFAPSVILEDLIWEQNHNWSKLCLFIKSSSYASILGIHPSFFISASLTANLFSVSALFCRKCKRESQPACLNCKGLPNFSKINEYN